VALVFTPTFKRSDFVESIIAISADMQDPEL
jgi:hypothetical protein